MKETRNPCPMNDFGAVLHIRPLWWETPGGSSFLGGSDASAVLHIRVVGDTWRERKKKAT